ncbi:MAG TPA: VWA domain-containing protein, partial [Pyrinomonadaceae bacterium]
MAALLLTAGVFAPASPARQDAGGDIADPERARVVVPLSAVDKEGRPVEALKAEDLRVTVEGQPQNILFFTRRTEEPLHVVVMLDASASQELVLPQVKPAAAAFVSALLRPGRDDAAVVSFTDGAKVVQGLTADASAVARAIASIRFVPPPGYLPGRVIIGRPPMANDPANRAGSTAVWDSLVNVCDEVFARAKPGRRAIVLVTDGVDTSSRVRLDKAVERLLREGVAVYGVGIGDEESFEGVNRKTVLKVSEPTGGRAVFPKKPKDAPAAFERIRGELLNSYALSFEAPTALRMGKPLKVRVELVNRELRRQGVQLS